MIEFHGLNFAFKSRAPLFVGCDAHFKRGVITGIIGRSGSGKTTILRLLQSKSITRFTEYSTLPTNFGDVAYIAPQQTAYLGLSVGEFIDFALSLAKSTKFRMSRNDYLQFCGNNIGQYIERLLQRRLARISSGQRQLIFISLAAFVSGPYILIDEPFTGLDPVSRGWIWALLTLVASTGRGIIIASHFIEEVVAYSSSFYLIIDKRLRLFLSEEEFVTEFGGRNFHEAFFRAHTVRPKR